MSIEQQRELEAFRFQKFLRLTAAAVFGVWIAHMTPMESTVWVGLFPASILLGMDRFSFRALTGRCCVLMFGLILGTLCTELFLNLPFLSLIVSYAVFFTALLLFAEKKYTAYCYNFIFSYSLSSIYSSYPDSTMELSIGQFYLIQLLLVFGIVWGCFVLFPAETPQREAAVPERESPKVPIHELVIYSLFCLGIWLFFMLFEWRFALFAFLSFMGAFRQFDRSAMKRVAWENIISHIVCCSVAAAFSMLIFGMAGNGFLLLIGLLLVLTPFTWLAVFPPRPELAYRHQTMISGILVPLILYLATEHAAVSQSALRASLIVFLMVVLFLVIEYLYYGITVSERIGRASAWQPARVWYRQRIRGGLCFLPTIWRDWCRRFIAIRWRV